MSLTILRLTLSDDTVPLPAAARRSWEIAAEMLEREVGQPVETVVRVIWPDAILPDLVERWMDRYRPEIVSLKVSPFWFTYESVPLKLQRRVPVVGKPLANAGLRAADTKALAVNPVFRAGRRTAHRLIGGETHFTPEHVIEVMEACIRRTLRHEGTILVVRGPLEADGDGSRSAFLRGERKRLLVHHRLKDLCAELHVHYTGSEEPRGFQRGRDELHLTAEGHVGKGQEEGEALIAAWYAARGAAAGPP